MSKYIELNNNLDNLKLTKIKEILPFELENFNKENKSLIDSLCDLTNAEIKFRDERACRINVVVSSFPYHKTINDFDFSYQPTINKQQIQHHFYGISWNRKDSFSYSYWYRSG